MKIVRIAGGLGNQMFQYAFLRSLEKHYGETVLADIRHFDSKIMHNGFELQDIFNIDCAIADNGQISQYSRNLKSYRISRVIRKIFPNKKTEFVEISSSKFNPEVFSHNDKVYFEGYWQCEKYFLEIENIIRTDFTFAQPLTSENRDFICKSQNYDTVSVHIRRGDYLKHPLYKGICDLSYYSESIKYIKNKVQSPYFVIFSNDITWCKEHILPLLNDDRHTFVDWNTGSESYNDMRIMSHCSHNIVANSSFSWWGAWLNNNPNKIVIAPKCWDNKSKEHDILCKSWILI